MKKNQIKTYLFFVLATELIGVVSGLISRGATEMYSGMNVSVPFAPPAILFPIVWTILYGLMGISAARIWLAPESKDRTYGLKFYVIQLIVNFFWSIIFFNYMAYGFAFIWLVLLWILIIFMIKTFAKVDLMAAKLQIPYLLWVTFAAYLNFAIWILNLK